jgi:hypothetical protein
MGWIGSLFWLQVRTKTHQRFLSERGRPQARIGMLRRLEIRLNLRLRPLSRGISMTKENRLAIILTKFTTLRMRGAPRWIQQNMI